jgi:hypothetical protein
MKHQPINFSPFRNNVLDYIGKELRTPDNKRVRIEQGSTFRIYINDILAHETMDNIDASYFLNRREVGVMQ